jgi:hypothetical protein
MLCWNLSQVHLHKIAMKLIPADHDIGTSFWMRIKCPHSYMVTLTYHTLLKLRRHYHNVYMFFMILSMYVVIGHCFIILGR